MVEVLRLNLGMLVAAAVAAVVVAARSGAGIHRVYDESCREMFVHI